MSEFTIFINYESNSIKLLVKCNESVKSLISKSLELYKITNNKDHYDLIYQGKSLGYNCLNMTLRELGLEENDIIILLYNPPEFPIIVFYNHRKKEIMVKENESLKSLMTKIFDSYGIEDRFYTTDKYLLTFNLCLLNSSNGPLNKTLKEIGIMEDDCISLVRNVDVICG